MLMKMRCIAGWRHVVGCLPIMPEYYEYSLNVIGCAVPAGNLRIN
jgi:hypothetical protein